MKTLTNKKVQAVKQELESKGLFYNTTDILWFLDNAIIKPNNASVTELADIVIQEKYEWNFN